ncbi:hypothetical protein [Dyadobacter flavalbus]|uniref:hypothetical protein n=1 Tax=Dyadobacter flavalbus TaxID=2579942 RepID=UPI001375F6D5|nr:hypothetical protein [Dyadobacter flavalbus]
MTQFNPTPMREPYIIEDKKMVNLVREIFITVDQGWTDVQAYEVSKLINVYISEIGKVD